MSQPSATALKIADRFRHVLDRDFTFTLNYDQREHLEQAAAAIIDAGLAEVRDVAANILKWADSTEDMLDAGLPEELAEPLRAALAKLV